MTKSHFTSQKRDVAGLQPPQSVSFFVLQCEFCVSKFEFTLFQEVKLLLLSRESIFFLLFLQGERCNSFNLMLERAVCLSAR